MRLKNYTPSRNEILLELKHYQKINNVYTPTPQADKIMKVLAVGPMVEKVKVGDLVLMDSTMMPQLEFDSLEAGGKPIIALQGREYNILGFYTPDEDETKFFVQIKPAGVIEEIGPKNIIDNPGIEKSPFLKELSNLDN